MKKQSIFSHICDVVGFSVIVIFCLSCVGVTDLRVVVGKQAVADSKVCAASEIGRAMP